MVMKRKACMALFVSVLVSGALIGLPGCSSNAETTELAQTGKSQEAPKVTVNKTELADLIEEAKKLYDRLYSGVKRCS